MKVDWDERTIFVELFSGSGVAVERALDVDE